VSKAQSTAAWKGLSLGTRSNKFYSRLKDRTGAPSHVPLRVPRLTWYEEWTATQNCRSAGGPTLNAEKHGNPGMDLESCPSSSASPLSRVVVIRNIPRRCRAVTSSCFARPHAESFGTKAAGSQDFITNSACESPVLCRTSRPASCGANMCVWRTLPACF
jgi:hypothetical protein